jgi:hypothetical protein
MLNYLAAAIALWFAFDLIVVLLFGGRPRQVPRNGIQARHHRHDRRSDGDRLRPSA